MEPKEEYYYCPEDCVHGCYGTLGDGRNEPMVPDFSCKKEDQLVDDGYFNFSTDPEDPKCPCYQTQEEVDEFKDNAVNNPLKLKSQFNQFRGKV